MVSVFRAQGLRIQIYADDHEPAHVHVFGDGRLKIDLGGADEAPRATWSRGMKTGDIRRAMQIVVEQKAFLIEKWSEIHG